MKNSISKKILSLLLSVVVMVSVCFIPSVSIETKALTQNQQNIVDRADYLYNLTWVAQKTVSAHAYSSYYTFTKGQTYHLPYGQGPVANYIGYGVSPENFVAAANDPNSVFYQYKSYAGSWYSTYYITDCSGFVSWCWGLTAKQSTRSLANYSSYVASITTNNIRNYLKVGDALNRYDYHVVLVTDLIYDGAGTLTGIEITEQTIPETKRTIYTPSGLASNYASYDGIYRYNGNVPAAPKTDEEPPVISDVKYSDVSASGYTISCKVTDDVAVQRVAFPTWTVYNGQDDLSSDWGNTQLGTKNGDRYTFRVNASDHNNESGSYATHIYAYDRAGNRANLALPTVEVRNDDENPVITDVVFSEVSASGYTVTCKVTDDWGVSKVAFPTWTVYNNQDDLPSNWQNTQLGSKDGDIYTFRVNASDHNNEGGKYGTHIYAYDCAGNSSCYELEAVEVRNDTQAPVISDVEFSEITSEGYKVTCTVTDDWGIEKVAFPTWTVNNAQDDLPAKFMDTQLGTRDGDTFTFYVKTADHNNELGYYATHIYAVDCAGNTTKCEPKAIEVKDYSDEITLTSSSTYIEDDTYLEAVKGATTVEDFLKQFENEDLKVLDKEGKELSLADLVGTGATVNLYNGENIVDSLTVVVAGDVDGNAVVDTTDYLRVKQTFLRSFTLSDAEIKAADVEENDIIDSTDCIRIKSHFLGSYDLYS